MEELVKFFERFGWQWVEEEASPAFLFLSDLSESIGWKDQKPGGVANLYRNIYRKPLSINGFNGNPRN